MKRLAAFAAILAMAAVQSAALADFTYPAEYTGGSADTATVSATGYSTVLITNDADDTIVYVNQSDSTFDGATDFLLKSDPAFGKYKVLLGSGSGSASPKETYFYVGVDSDEAGDLSMNRLRNEESGAETGTCNIGYYAEVPANVFNDYESIKVGYDQSGSSVYGGFPLNAENWTTYTGDGALYLIFQLNDVPNTIKDSVAVYLSEDTVSSSPLRGN